MNAPAPHIPVMLDEVMHALAPREGECIIDGTFGAGGYSRAIMDAADCSLHAFDRDPNVAPHVDQLNASHKDRFTFHAACFSEMHDEMGDKPVHGIVLDIGVSSMQIDTPERGFSFRFDGPLDMRMSASGQSAADIVNQSDEAELARILWDYGEERASRRIARAIVTAREEAPIETTAQLKALIHRVNPARGQKIDPATRSFQALRIAVNRELGELEDALHAAETLLMEGGRLVVVTFHSLEDRMVKRFLKQACEGGQGGSRHLPDAGDAPAPTFRYISRKAITASEAEMATNPRARSAKLRAAIRTDAPARNVEIGHA